MPNVQFFSDDPSLQTNAIRLQQQQAIAQALLDESQQSYNSQFPSNLRVIPRMGIAGGLVKLGQALMAGKMMDSNSQAQGQLNANYYHGLVGMMGGDSQPGFMGGATPASAPVPSQPGPQQAPVDPKALAIGQALQGGAAQGSIGPTTANAARMDAAMAATAGGPQGAGPLGQQQSLDPVTPMFSQDQRVARPDPVTPMFSQDQRATRPTGSSPMNPTGIAPQLAAMSFASNPTDYLKTVIGQMAPTDFQKVAIAAGYRPGTPEYNQLLQANLQKQNYMPPVPMRPGGGLMDPHSGAITTMPGAAPAGFQNVQLADGSWGTVPVRGGTQAVTQSTAAGEAGKAPFQLIDTFNGATGIPGKNYAGNTLQPPQIPGLSQGAAPQPSQGSGLDSGAPATFDLHGPVQRQVAILADIARNGPSQAVRAAATQRLQDMHALGTTGSTGGSQPAQQQPAGAVGAGGANGVQTGPALGQAQGATNAQEELSKSWTQQQQAQAAAQTNIGLLQSVKGLADKAITGYEPDRRMLLAQLGAYAGLQGQIDSATSTDLMNKYSAQLIGSLSQKGMDTDAARQIVQAGTPNSHMQPQAIKDAVDGLVAREQMTQARTGVLQPYALNRDAAGFQSAASRFDAVADPRLWQMKGMTPQQIQAFTAKMAPGDARQLMQKYQAASQMGAFQ